MYKLFKSQNQKSKSTITLSTLFLSAPAGSAHMKDISRTGGACSTVSPAYYKEVAGSPCDLNQSEDSLPQLDKSAAPNARRVQRNRRLQKETAKTNPLTEKNACFRLPQSHCPFLPHIKTQNKRKFLCRFLSNCFFTPQAFTCAAWTLARVLVALALCFCGINASLTLVFLTDFKFKQHWSFSGIIALDCLFDVVKEVREASTGQSRDAHCSSARAQIKFSVY